MLDHYPLTFTPQNPQVRYQDNHSDGLPLYIILKIVGVWDFLYLCRGTVDVYANNFMVRNSWLYLIGWHSFHFVFSGSKNHIFFVKGNPLKWISRWVNLYLRQYNQILVENIVKHEKRGVIFQSPCINDVDLYVKGILFEVGWVSLKYFPQIFYMGAIVIYIRNQRNSGRI